MLAHFLRNETDALKLKAFYKKNQQEGCFWKLKTSKDSAGIEGDAIFTL